MESRHVSVHIERSAADVYAFTADLANLPRWAAGLGGAIDVEGDTAVVRTPDGPARVTFVPRNEHGVLDHEVRTASGQTVQVPLRVVRDGDGAEVVLTVRPPAGATADEVERDVAAVRADLDRLRALLEAPPA